ncbi:Mga1p PWA37_003929 [Arxiozyma heterogenica]|uniref:Mga1p n=1 Tax=Arxiozyma heterogenica TaxID=278026 RepID=UPI002F01C2EF
MVITKTFVHQLHYIISEPSTNDLIGWADPEYDNNSFFLKPHDKRFAELVLKRHFKHGNVSSFVRQLHMYGFHKLPNTENNTKNQTANTNHNAPKTKLHKSEMVWYFTHPSGYFTRDSNRELLSKIHRKTTGMGKDGKRKNILSPVCVSYFDHNGNPIHSQHVNMFQNNLPLTDRFGNQTEINMGNQLNMMNEVPRGSVSYNNTPGSQVRVPEARTYSQPLLQTSPRLQTVVGASNQNNNIRISQSTSENNGIYYGSDNNSSFTTTSSLLLPYNRNNLQFHIQSQNNLPLQTTYNITSSSSMMSLPYMTSSIPISPSVGYIPQAAPSSNHQSVLKPTPLNGTDPIPISTYDGVNKPTTRPYFINGENTQSIPNLPITQKIYVEKTNSNILIPVTYSLVGPVPQHSSQPALTKLKNSEPSTQDYTQPKVLPLSSDSKITEVNNTSAISTSSVPKKNSEEPLLSPVHPTQKVLSDNNDNNRSEKESQLDKNIQACLSNNLQDLVKSLVSITDTLNRIRSPDCLISSRLNITTDDSGKVNIELDGKQIKLDQLINMLSEVKTKLIDNDDIISKTLISAD